jgi:molybdopterin-binding protein
MQVSARNQLRATVKQIPTDGLMAEVVLDVGGQEMVSIITKASSDRRGAKPSDAVVAIVKTSEAIIGK